MSCARTATMEEKFVYGHGFSPHWAMWRTIKSSYRKGELASALVYNRTQLTKSPLSCILYSHTVNNKHLFTPKYEIVQNFENFRHWIIHDIHDGCRKTYRVRMKPLSMVAQYRWKMKLSPTRPRRFPINFGQQLFTGRCQAPLPLLRTDANRKID